MGGCFLPKLLRLVTHHESEVLMLTCQTGNVTFHDLAPLAKHHPSSDTCKDNQFQDYANPVSPIRGPFHQVAPGYNETRPIQQTVHHHRQPELASVDVDHSEK